MSRQKPRKDAEEETHEQTALEAFRTIQGEMALYRERIDVVENQQERFRDSVRKRVQSDYRAKIEELEEKLEPQRVKLEEEYEQAQSDLEEVRIRLDQTEERLEELALRNLTGELAEDSFTPEKEQAEGEIESLKGELRELERQSAEYEELLFQPDEEEAPASEPEEDLDDFQDLDEGETLGEAKLDEAALELEAAEEEPGEDGWDAEAAEVDRDGEPAETGEPPLEDEEVEAALDALTPIEDSEGEDAAEGQREVDEEAAALDEEDLPLEEMEDDLGLPERGAYLEIAEGESKGAAFEIDSDVVTIGRGPDNDIQLAVDASVSRHHSQIVRREGRFTLMDLASSNGSYVNGIRIREQGLAPNDTVMIGTTRMIFKMPGKDQYLT